MNDHKISVGSAKDVFVAYWGHEKIHVVMKGDSKGMLTAHIVHLKPEFHSLNLAG